MFPLIPYNGVLRPALMVVYIALTVTMIMATQKLSWRRKLHSGMLLLYIVFLGYATFFSRNVSIKRSYRLSLFYAMRQAFALDGSIKDVLLRFLIGDFSGFRISNPEALEAIVLNILMFIPLGYLLPQVFPRLRYYQIIGIGLLMTVSIETGQLITRLGMFDCEDMMDNVIGTAVGAALWKLCNGKEANKR